MDKAMKKNINNAVEAAFESVVSGISLVQQGQISQTDVEALYALGFNYYCQKNFAKAEGIFEYAVRFDPYHLGIVNGLAAARKVQGKYDDALKAYALAGLLDLSDPKPSFYAAECFFAKQQWAACNDALDAALGLAEDDDKYKKLCTQIEKMKTNLKENHYE